MLDIKIAKKRANLINKIRKFFIKNSFTEVETPIMTRIPGMEPYLTPFETTLKTSSNKQYTFFLNTSPELQMKKLLGAGFGNIFQITKVFRNGETNGSLHNSEFTMLEWYRENANYFDLMTDCEKLITSLTDTWKTPWKRSSMRELFLSFCNIDLLKNKNFKEFKKTAACLNYDTNGCNTWDDIFFKIFLNHIEPNLGKEPIFIYDYPVSQAALAKKKKGNNFFAERFELYIGGMELANAYSELIDGKEQRLRLKQEQKLRKRLNKTVFDIDEEFIQSLESIKQSCAGIALGIDRLIMLLLNKKNIEDVLLFPLSSLL